MSMVPSGLPPEPIDHEAVRRRSVQGMLGPDDALSVGLAPASKPRGRPRKDGLEPGSSAARLADAKKAARTAMTETLRRTDPKRKETPVATVHSRNDPIPEPSPPTAVNPGIQAEVARYSLSLKASGPGFEAEWNAEGISRSEMADMLKAFTEINAGTRNGKP